MQQQQRNIFLMGVFLSSNLAVKCKKKTQKNDI